MKSTEITLANGVKIPQLGLGVFQVKDEGDLKHAVHWALEAGYRHIDTAAYYGNEKWVGEVVRDSIIPRRDLFITSKLWNSDHGYEQTKAAFHQTIKNLGVNHLDLYLIHWPTPDFAESWRAMEELYHDGKIKAIGVSNFEQSHLEELMKTAKVKPMIDQIETHPYFQQNELQAYLKKEGIIHEAWSPLGGGENSVLTDPVIGEIAKAHGKSPAQVVIRWHIQRGEVVIPKSIHEARINENIDVFDFDLTEAEMEKIGTLDQGKRVGPDPNDPEFIKKTVALKV